MFKVDRLKAEGLRLKAVRELQPSDCRLSGYRHYI